jgi:hypothetical protein
LILTVLLAWSGASPLTIAGTFLFPFAAYVFVLNVVEPRLQRRPNDVVPTDERSWSRSTIQRFTRGWIRPLVAWSPAFQESPANTSRRSPNARRTTLPVVTTYVRGEARSPKTRPNGKKHQTSGVNIHVSHGDFNNLKRQVRDAVCFVSRHRVALRRLKRIPGVEDVTLDFGVAHRDVAAQFDYFPPELAAAAGLPGIGIEVSRYHTAGGG